MACTDIFLWITIWTQERAGYSTRDANNICIGLSANISLCSWLFPWRQQAPDIVYDSAMADLSYWTFFRGRFSSVQFLLFFFLLPALHIIHTHKTTTGAVTFQHEVTIWLFSFSMRMGNWRNAILGLWTRSLFNPLFFFFWNDRIWHAIYLQFLPFWTFYDWCIMDLLKLQFDMIFHGHHPEKRRIKIEQGFGVLRGGHDIPPPRLVSAKGPEAPSNVPAT